MEISMGKSLEECLPDADARACWFTTVAAAFDGVGMLAEQEREVIAVICLRRTHLCRRTKQWLNELEAREGQELVRT
jgi:hypothetical protein